MKTSSEQVLSTARLWAHTRVLSVALILLVVIVVGTILWLQFGSYLTGAGGEVAPPAVDAETTSATGSSEKAVVALSAEEFQAAELHTSPVELRDLQEVRRVPGRIVYNENEYLPVTSPVRGIVREVKVRPGQTVKQGDVLAVISSSEIGVARSDLQLREAELQIATQEFAWAEEISRNVDGLLALLEQRPEMSTIEQSFKGKLLGDHRDDILAAYSKLRLAENANTRTSPLGERGVVSGRLVQERQSERDVAAANFLSACEQTKLECIGAHNRAEVALDNAKRLVTISIQHLAALRGPFSGDAPTPDGNALNDLALHASIDGEVTKKNVVPATRVDVTDLMFVLANTDTLWVSAELRESDWETLESKAGGTVEVETPAIPDRKFQAQIRFIGSEISEVTRALPLVAELQNVDGLLKPGLFVWVSVPVGNPRRAIAVPPSAVLQHEGKTFVFVASEPGSYRRRDVEVGVVTPAWTEIRRGLEEGQQVVDRGAFYLKSELLLEGDD